MAADLLRDESNLEGSWCDEAAWPENAAEAAAYVASASKKGGVTISGGRTGIVAGGLPLGGCALSTCALLRTDRIAPGIVRTGAGVVLKDFRDICRGTDSGFFFPPDPTEETATIGGMAATDASGSDSYLFGSTRRWISGLEAVLSGGRITRLRRGEYVFGPDGRCRHPEIGNLSIPPEWRVLPKNAAGYRLAPGMDLVDLLLGSEGTLCLITSVDVILERCQDEVVTAVAFPASAESAWGLVSGLRSSGIPLRALEMMDGRCLDFLSTHPAEGTPPPPAGASAAVIFRIGAASRLMEESLEKVEGLLSDAGIRDDEVWGGTGEDDQKRIRSFRHSLPEAVNAEISSRRRRIPGIHKLGSDAAVAPELLPSFYAEMVSLLEDGGFEFLVFGHAGQGHLHANILPSTPSGLEAGEEAMDRIAGIAVRMGGTVSAEHGLGRLKGHQLGIMYSAAEIEAMRELRRTVDPDRVFAPAIAWP